MSDIKQLDYGVMLVNGHIVCVKNDALDITTDSGQAKLIDLADKMGTGVRGMPYGPCTVLYVFPEIDGKHGRRHVIELRSPRWFPEHVRAMLRKELPEYADEF